MTTFEKLTELVGNAIGFNCKSYHYPINKQKLLQGMKWSNWNHSWSYHKGYCYFFVLKDGQWTELESKVDLFYFKNGDCWEEREGLVKEKTMSEMYGEQWEDVAVAQLYRTEEDWECKVYSSLQEKEGFIELIIEEVPND